MKKRVFAFAAALILVVVFVAVPCSALSFPDTMMNILDCELLFERMSSRLKNENMTFSSDAATGSFSVTWNGIGSDIINTNYLGTFRELCPQIKAGVWYTFHCEQSAGAEDQATAPSLVSEGWKHNIHDGHVFMLAEEDLDRQVFVAMYNITPGNELHTVSHMVITPSALPLSGTFTDETYPQYFDFTAYKQSFFDSGFNEGVVAGKQQAASDFSKLSSSIFDTASYSCILKVDTGTGATVDVEWSSSTPNLFDGGVYFQTLYDQIFSNAEYEERLDQVYIVMKWSEEDAFNYAQYPIGIQGDSLVQSATMTCGSKVYSLDASEGSSNDVRQFVLTEATNDPLLVTEFRLLVGRPYDLLNSFTLIADIVQYNKGFANGYTEGLSQTAEDMYQLGRDEGYGKGYTDGKKDGVKIAETGDWRSVIGAVVEAPVNTFQSLFHFEILGLDMRLAFGSILAICVMLIIVKKVLT